ncbi:7464_t:CDS:10 [Ambispora gerdemannii]|uniref:7464_t:CDS:1 n=1 Tax=Ambispora gerdemannii TaxID=144530 RepID=A0A9N8ZJW2_9GLOM|nr:7464_t:CDS:10 [Ambispora gerdemannii]
MFALGNHVTHILLAEFDIDRGASLTHQYPQITGTDEHLLAELMLPDGAHLRPEDWTVFFLNQTIPNIDDISINTTKRMSSDDKEGDEEDRPSLLYALNLVRTKHDKEARRGAVVKAMAICTKHQFLHIYKPILLLALENYFQDPSIKCLESLYEAVNSMDVSFMPRFSPQEKAILRASESKDLFEEKFVEFEKNKNRISNYSTGSNNQNNNNNNNQVAAATQENVVKATVPLSSNAENMSHVDTPEEERLARMRRGAYIDLSSRELLPNLSNVHKDRHFYETKVHYNGINLPIRVPLTVNPEEVGDFSLIKLITTFSPPSPSPNTHPFHPHLDTSGNQTHPIILLVNALLTQKRIIFLGQGHPSGDVANYVLAACAMGSGSGGVLRGFSERAFPYTNLTQLDDLLKVPGFIAGVTNRIFEDHSSWWDVLCNIDTGKITVSKDIVTPSYGTKQDDRPDEGAKSPSSKNEPWGREKWDMTDHEFMTEVMHAIQHHYGETAIRGKFQEYVQRFVRLTALYEIETFGSTKIGITPANTDTNKILGTGLAFPDENAKLREVAANMNRMEGWRQTISYKYYQQDFQHYLKTRSIKSFDVYFQIAKLRTLKNMQTEEVETLYKAFVDSVHTDEQIIEFLSYLPQNQGGLFPVGLGLFHPLKSVRGYTIELFNRINEHVTGNKFVQTLNFFLKYAYERQLTLQREQQQIVNKIAAHQYDNNKFIPSSPDNKNPSGNIPPPPQLTAASSANVSNAKKEDAAFSAEVRRLVEEGKLDKAYRIVLLSPKQVLSQEVWNILITECVKEGKVSRGFLLLTEMKRRGFLPNEIQTYTILLNGMEKKCTFPNNIVFASTVIDIMVLNANETSIYPNTAHGNALLSACDRDMGEEKLEMNDQLAAAMICCCRNAGETTKGYEIVEKVYGIKLHATPEIVPSEYDVEMTAKSLDIILGLFHKVRAESKGLRFFKRALTKFPKTIALDIQNINLLIFLNIQTRKYREALTQIQYIRTHNLKPVLRTYDLLLNACRLAGNFIAAKKLIAEMRERGMKANAMVITSILTCTVNLPTLKITDLCWVLDQIEGFGLDILSLKNRSYKIPFKVNPVFLRSMISAYSLARDMADKQLLDEKFENWTFFEEFYSKKLETSSKQDSFSSYEEKPPKTLKVSAKQDNLMTDEEKPSRKLKGWVGHQNDSTSDNEISEPSSTDRVDYLITGERNVKLVRQRFRPGIFDAEFNDREKSSQSSQEWQSDPTNFKSHEKNYGDRGYRNEESNDTEDRFAQKSKAEKSLKYQEDEEEFLDRSNIKERAKPKYNEIGGSKTDARYRGNSWSNSSFERQEKPRYSGYNDRDDNKYSRFATRDRPEFNIKSAEQRPRYYEQEQEYSRPRFREIENNKGKYRQNYSVSNSIEQFRSSGVEENNYEDYRKFYSPSSYEVKKRQFPRIMSEESQPNSRNRKSSDGGSFRDTSLRQPPPRFSNSIRSNSGRSDYNERPQRSSFRRN